jgi:hypothetical protein
VLDDSSMFCSVREVQDVREALVLATISEWRLWCLDSSMFCSVREVQDVREALVLTTISEWTFVAFERLWF